MKKILLILLGVLTALPTFALDFKYEYQGQTLNYTVINKAEKTVKVSKSDKVSGVLSIPEIAKNGDVEYSVIEIGSQALSNCNELTSVTIPNSVITIGEEAFYSCQTLSEVTLGNSIEKICARAFNQCAGWGRLIIPSSVTNISDEAFLVNNGFSVVAILGTNLTFGYQPINNKPYALLFCPEGVDVPTSGAYIKTIIDPESTLEFLEDGTVLADNGKTLVKSVMTYNTPYIIPDGVVTIKKDAFSFPSLMTGTLTIPASVEVVEAGAFRFTEFERVNFIDWPKWYENVKLSDLESNPYRNCGPYAGGVKVVPELKEGLTEIKDYINCGLQFNDEVELPSTLKR
ncbi:MAG: leucine-rich repeat domain-containing protein, partial [Muribaculaceae bacterium]|nr:leucine-rich repeat domain-containing protein [Muribaculaceae bacterium]